MKRKRHTPEQSIAKLREADAALAPGKSVADIARQFGVSEATYHCWRQTYGGMKGPEMKRLKELERENAQLKKFVADLSLDKAMLKELAKGNF